MGKLVQFPRQGGGGTKRSFLLWLLLFSGETGTSWVGAPGHELLNSVFGTTTQLRLFFVIKSACFSNAGRFNPEFDLFPSSRWHFDRFPKIRNHETTGILGVFKYTPLKLTWNPQKIDGFWGSMVFPNFLKFQPKGHFGTPSKPFVFSGVFSFSPKKRCSVRFCATRKSWASKTSAWRARPERCELWSKFTGILCGYMDTYRGRDMVVYICINKHVDLILS